jgi:hypothetical protein
MFSTPYLCKSSQQWQCSSKSKIVYGDKDIHSSLSVVREKVEDLPLNICSILQNNSCDSISKCIMGYYMVIPKRALKQMSI